MANLGKSLQERARLANVGGDIRYGQFVEEQEQTVQSKLGEMTDEAFKRQEGGYEHDEIVDLLKFGTSFIPGWGKVASTALSFIDMYLAHEARQDDLPMPDLEGVSGVYKDYLEDQKLALEDQMSGVDTANIMGNLLNVATNVLTLEPGNLGVDAWGGDTLFDRWGDETWFKTAQNVVPGLGTALGLHDEALPILGPTDEFWQNLFVHGSPKAANLLMPKKSATMPKVPGIQRPSLRRGVR